MTVCVSACLGLSQESVEFLDLACNTSCLLPEGAELLFWSIASPAQIMGSTYQMSP
jgi:hypothetical protein